MPAPAGRPRSPRHEPGRADHCGLRQEGLRTVRQSDAESSSPSSHPCAYSAHSAMQVRFYRIDRHAHGCCDIAEVHLLLEAENKCGALIERESLQNGRDFARTLARQQLLFGRACCAGQHAGYLGHIRSGLAHLLPEAELLRALIIPDKVQRDRMKPGLHAAVAAKVMAIGPRLYEAVLHNGGGEILVAERERDKPQKPRTVRLDQVFDIVQLSERTLTAGKAENIRRHSHLHASVDGFLRLGEYRDILHHYTMLALP